MYGDRPPRCFYEVAAQDFASTTTTIEDRVDLVLGTSLQAAPFCGLAK